MENSNDNIKRDTKSIGSRSELEVLAALARAGYSVLVPFGENARYDLIADNGADLWRIQVKTGRLRDGVNRFNCFSVHSDPATRTRTYLNEIEYFGVYCPDTRTVSLVPVGAAPRKTYGSLRWAPPKRGQWARVRWARAYDIPPAPARTANGAGARDTKKIGNRSEIEVMVALARKGYLVSYPLGENQRYDLIADRGGILSRVQVKTGRLRNGAILFNGYSSHSHRNGPSCRSYANEIDYFGVFCPELGAVHLLPIGDAATKSGALRVHPARNGQTRRVRWADTYLVRDAPGPTT